MANLMNASRLLSHTAREAASRIWSAFPWHRSAPIPSVFPPVRCGQLAPPSRLDEIDLGVGIAVSDQSLAPQAYPPVSRVLLAPFGRIEEGSLARCIAAYLESRRRGPASAAAISVRWSLLPLDGDHVVAAYQGKLVKYMRDWTRRRGLPHAFIISAIERDSLGLHGHFLVQAYTHDLDDLMNAVECQLFCRYGDLPPLAYERGSSTFPYDMTRGRITSVATGLSWLRYCLKGCMQNEYDLCSRFTPKTLAMQGVAIRWGFGREDVGGSTHGAPKGDGASVLSGGVA